MIKSDKNIFSSPVSSDLFVPFFAGRTLHEVRALQDGVLPHPDPDLSSVPHGEQTVQLQASAFTSSVCQSMIWQTEEM